jgi:CPA1 family monovalent cation:H+ antiporter
MTAQHLLFLLGVPFFSVVVSALARRFDLNGPLVLVVVGLLVSVPSLRDNWSAVLILSVGMALVTTLLTGFAMHWLIPGMPLPVAFVLGAVLGHLRAARMINDEVYRRVLHQLDLEEAYMERR